MTIEGFTVVGMPRAGIRSVTNEGVIIRNNRCDQNGKWGILTGFSENVTHRKQRVFAIRGRARDLCLEQRRLADRPRQQSLGKLTPTDCT